LKCALPHSSQITKQQPGPLRRTDDNPSRQTAGQETNVPALNNRLQTAIVAFVKIKITATGSANHRTSPPSFVTPSPPPAFQTPSTAPSLRPHFRATPANAVGRSYVRNKGRQAAMSATRTSTRRHRTLPARYQQDDNERSSPPTSQSIPATTTALPTTTTASTTTTAAVTVILPPRGLKRTRSASSSTSYHLPRKNRPSTTTVQPNKTPQLDHDPVLPADMQLPPKPTQATTKPPLPRITVPLDIDTTHVQLPCWLDMSTNYWLTWRHMYDKWQIQKRFASLNARLYGAHEGLQIATRELDRLLYIREKLLMDCPDRQDIDLREGQTVRRIWRFLRGCQTRGEDVAKFNCVRVKREMRWDLPNSDDDEEMEGEGEGRGWRQVSNFLIDQGNEGRIFIDPRTYYDHYSWIVEDFAGQITSSALEKLYQQFACRTVMEPNDDILGSQQLQRQQQQREVVDCAKCSPSAEYCSCEDSCLLCLPRTETVAPISSLSSLLSPPRTPGTQSLPSYFKGRRLSHPPAERPVVEYTEDEAVDILLSFSGASRRKRRKQSVDA
jgi:hypothetical protein